MNFQATNKLMKMSNVRRGITHRLVVAEQMKRVADLGGTDEHGMPAGLVDTLRDAFSTIVARAAEEGGEMPKVVMERLDKDTGRTLGTVDLSDMLTDAKKTKH